MNRKKDILVILMLACLLSACQKGQKEKEVIEFHDVIPEEAPVILRDANYVPQTEVTEEKEETDEQDEEQIVPFCDFQSVDYQVKVEKFEQGAFAISYPVVYDMEQTDMMDQINNKIQSYLMPEKIMEDEGYLTYEVVCEITSKGSGVLSFVCRGYEMYEGAAHPSQFVLTMNIDMITGENIRLKDYANIEEIVSGLELDTGYSLLNSSIEVSELGAFLNNGYVTDYAMTLLDYDIDFQQEEYAPLGYSYIKENHPVVCIPVEHAIGDYVEVYFEKEIDKYKVVECH